MADNYGLVPGKKLCLNCPISLRKPEEPEETNIDSDFQDTFLKWERLKMSVAGFGFLHWNLSAIEIKWVMEKAIWTSLCAVKDKVAIPLDLESNLIEKEEDKVHCYQKGKDLDRLMDMVGQKVKFD